MNARRDLLELALSPALLEALDEHIRDVVDEAIREERARQPRRDWLTLEQGAIEYGCSVDALRMRVKRGTVESRRHGRALYVRAHDASREKGGLP